LVGQIFLVRIVEKFLFSHIEDLFVYFTYIERKSF